jgi:hypothetical protein
VDEEKLMIGPSMKAEDVEKLAKSLRLNLKSGNSETIAPMLAGIRETVYRKASALEQDAPLSLYFDARWGVGGND